MCYIWLKQTRAKELSVAQIREVFNDGLIKNNLEIINITGGEPTLRPDLDEIVKIILGKCSRLKRIDLSTNGVDTSGVVDQIERVLAILLPAKVKLTVSISLDGVGETYEQVRGVPDIFVNVERTIKELTELMSLYRSFSLGFNMTITKLNYQAVEAVEKYASQKNIGINFTLAALSEIGVESMKVRDKFELDDEQKKRVVLSLKDMADVGAIDNDYLKFLTAWLKTGERTTKCAFKLRKAFLLEPNGDAYMCGNFKEARMGNILEEPFGDMWRRSADTIKRVSDKCLNCASNCYLK